MRCLLLLVLLPLAGCATRTNQDIGQIEQGTYNAAASLPPSPQTQAIMANAVTVGQLVGQPLTTISTTAAPVAGATP